ncbi:SusD/RagB family nutrient-binding outer membrane lipoprotein [Flagellimonas myxillae]|uniref:SusD/RagB family nutrient-binding outer membrane lipoprotein n=1 Tax=Flagellimonas myxillae TaxID=2942214 RepID=UPI00201EAD2F|nr:SusD/RagB family nutrient-binding outer membrane lipoprotein [Muricauda myxillae]MCL6266302.1 SusD/RagB family nutrient-binding outer membrane lipoprotein [Muricauda myxillae]
MKVFKISAAIVILSSFLACQEIVDDINDNDPNTISTVDGQTLFTGMQLADITAQLGYLNWAAGVWTGNFAGSGRFAPIQEYQYGNTNSDTPWFNIYVGVVQQARELRSGIPVTNKDFFFGASKVLEAHALGTAASMFGDVPFTEAVNPEIPTPAYDGQLAVYSGLQSLLDEAIADLQAAGTGGGISEDLFFGGDSNGWIRAAYTLKARLYLEVGDYGSAIGAVQNGVSMASESMQYTPPAVVLTGDTNLLNQFFTGSFPDDLTTEGTYLIELMTGVNNRNNAKTDEVDRAAYYFDGTQINLNGIAGVDEPMNLVSVQESLLTWAEAAIRSNDFATALTKLNEHRSNLRNGEHFAITTGIYDDYVQADFESGGIENVDGSLSMEDALLREIIQERYVSFFAELVSFTDLRRTKKDPVAIQVGVPFNVGSQHPERFLYPFSEENTNEANVPDIADIFVKTPVNQ